MGLKHGFLVGRFESNSGDGVGFNLIGGLALASDTDDVGSRRMADGGRRMVPAKVDGGW